MSRSCAFLKRKIKGHRISLLNEFVTRGLRVKVFDKSKAVAYRPLIEMGNRDALKLVLDRPVDDDTVRLTEQWNAQRFTATFSNMPLRFKNAILLMSATKSALQGLKSKKAGRVAASTKVLVDQLEHHVKSAEHFEMMLEAASTRISAERRKGGKVQCFR